MLKKRILVGKHTGPGAGLVEAGPFLFTSGCDGAREPEAGRIVPALAGAAEAQCENSYGAIASLLRQANLGMDAVVRLDHFTSSQDWLPRRQAIRARFFGKPAPLASTGVAAKMAGINMLTTAVIAVRPPEEKKILVSGPAYRMENISSAVLAGPLLFISGLRGTVDPRSGVAAPEETPDALQAQVRICYEVMKAILSQCGATTDDILRLDCFLRDVHRSGEEIEARRSALGEVECAATTVGLPLGARGEIEITALALAPGQGRKKVYQRANGAGVAAVCGGGLVFVGECLGGLDETTTQPLRELADNPEKQIHNALDSLVERLRSCGAGLGAIARLDVYLRDIYWVDRLEKILRSRFRTDLPAVVVAGAELSGISSVSLSAIAVQDGGQES